MIYKISPLRLLFSNGFLKAFATFGCGPHRRKRLFLASLLFSSAIMLLFSTGCGSDSSSSSSSGTISVTITPQSAILPVSSAQQFSASVANADNTDVTWQVNGTTGGTSTFGTISSSGLYTAPSSAPAASVTVTAIAKADTSKSASAIVTITNVNSLVLSPSNATLSAGGQQTFTATLGDNVINAVWSLSCNSTAAGACGTISGGVYTAPLSPPPQQWVSITASTSNNSASPAHAELTITYGSGTLYGHYAFTMRGVNVGEPFSEAGSVVFDGKGGITGGALDRSDKAAPVTITGGSYASDANGRVTATIHTDSGDEGWQITLVDHSRAFVMRVDSVVARGDLDLQDSSKFGQSLAGKFTFRLAGSGGSSAIPFAGMIGALNVDSSGVISNAILDVNDGGSVSTELTASGNISASASTNGRGTLTIASSYGTQNFAYYLLDSYNAALIETDGAHSYTGRLTWSGANSVTPSYFSGNYSFLFSGANSGSAVGQGGTFTLDSYGNVSNGTFDSATDTAFGLGYLFSGTLAVTDSTSGRSTVTFNVGGSTLKYVAYPWNLSGETPFLEIDDKNATAGLALRFSNPPTSTLQSGHFAMNAGEIMGSIANTQTGTVLLPGDVSAILDTNQSGNVTLGSMASNSLTMNSVYGRGQLNLATSTSSRSFMTYLYDRDTVLMLETDGKGLLTGIMRRRY